MPRASGAGDQLAGEVVGDVLVIGVVLPGFRKLFRPEAAGNPVDQKIAAVGVHPVDNILPDVEARRRKRAGSIFCAVPDLPAAV